jgi:hypothetical protein
MLRGMLPLAIIAIATAALGGESTLGSLKQAYEAEIQKIESAYDARLRKLLDTYGRSLDRAVPLLKRKGDPDAVLQALAEKQRFEQERTVPAEPNAELPRLMQDVQTSYLKAVGKADDEKSQAVAAVIPKYVAALDRLMKKLTVEEKLDLAMNARQEKERAEFILADVAAKLPKNTATSPASSPLSTSAQPEASPWRDITRTFSGGNRRHSGIVLKKSRTESRDSYAVPVEIEYVCMTDSTNIRLAYACRHLIFNWEVNRSALRIDGGPANGKHRPGAGEIPTGEFVTIRQVVEKDSMSVFVDDELRATWRADFSAVDSPIAVFSTHGATVTVKSVRIREAQGD